MQEETVMSQRTVLVTGGAGFIGSELVRQLLGEGSTVAIYDNLSFGHVTNLPQHSNLQFENGDLTDSAHVRSFVRTFAPDKVFHLAALHFIPYCMAHPQETMRTNVEGTSNVLEACKSSSVTTVVCASTAAVYGIQETPHAEVDLVDPIDIYGLSKLCTEHLVKLFHRETGIRCGIARLFNAYGPRETNPHLIPEIVKQLAAGNRIELGNLAPKRDYIHTSDLCRALRLMADAQNFQLDTFNVGTGQGYSARDLIELFSDLSQTEITVVSTEGRRRATERQNLVADVTKIGRVLRWKPEVSMKDGLRDLLDTSGLLSGSGSFKPIPG
jgi:UDP-glucose 4-epimerase